MWCVVGFENIEALEFLVENRYWLEFLRLDHLRLEPILDLVLFHLFKILMVIVEMSIQLQQRYLQLSAIAFVGVCRHTISSLHIGQTSLELAAATAALSPTPWSRDILELRSCGSSDC